MFEIRLQNDRFDLDCVKIWFYNREEYARTFGSLLNDYYPELTNMKYIAYSANEENPYEVVVYDNGEVWIYGANFDTDINAQADTFSNAIVALKMLVAGEDRELNQYDAEKFNADLDFSEVK